MNKDTLVLKDGTAIELEAGASLGNIQVAFPNKAAMVEVWDKLTKDNLAEVQIQNGAGLTVGRYENLVLISETSTPQEDGGLLTAFHFREKDILEKRVDAIEEGQAMQDGAILDMAGELTNTQMAITEVYETMGGAE